MRIGSILYNCLAHSTDQQMAATIIDHGKVELEMADSW